MVPPEIAQYLSRWSLREDGDVIETPMSRLLPVRRADGPAMLKLLKPGSDERNAAGLLAYYDGQGAVRLFAADDGALLMERASGTRSLGAMATGGRDDAAADVLADAVAVLHAPRDQPPPAALTPLSEQFASLFDRDDQDALLARCAAVARRLLASAADRLPLHGDLHHGNVLDGGARGWLAIDPKGLIGERTYDVANLLRNPWPHGNLVHSRARMQRLARRYADRLDLDPRRVLDFAFAHAGLSACWDMEDGEDPAYSLACAEVLSSLSDA